MNGQNKTKEELIENLKKISKEKVDVDSLVKSLKLKSETLNQIINK